jgi:hypothetical protein
MALTAPVQIAILITHPVGAVAVHSVLLYPTAVAAEARVVANVAIRVVASGASFLRRAAAVAWEATVARAGHGAGMSMMTPASLQTTLVVWVRNQVPRIESSQFRLQKWHRRKPKPGRRENRVLHSFCKPAKKKRRGN